MKKVKKVKKEEKNQKNEKIRKIERHWKKKENIQWLKIYTKNLQKETWIKPEKLKYARKRAKIRGVCEKVKEKRVENIKNEQKRQKLKKSEKRVQKISNKWNH